MGCAEGIMRGKVQHVHLRAMLQSRANQLGLVGWLHNRYDGSVDFKVEGNQNGIDNFKHYIVAQPGPSLKSHVTGVEFQSCKV